MNFFHALFLLSLACGSLSRLIWNVVFFHCSWGSYRFTFVRVNVNRAPNFSWCRLWRLILCFGYSSLLNFVLLCFGWLNLSRTEWKKWKQIARNIRFDTLTHDWINFDSIQNTCFFTFFSFESITATEKYPECRYSIDVWSATAQSKMQ